MWIQEALGDPSVSIRLFFISCAILWTVYECVEAVLSYRVSEKGIGDASFGHDLLITL